MQDWPLAATMQEDSPGITYATSTSIAPICKIPRSISSQDKEHLVVSSWPQPVVVVASKNHFVNSLAVIAYYSPNILIVPLAILLLVLAYRVRAKASMRQIPGKAYCAKCGYRIVSSTTEKCPECGADLVGRGGIEYGRSILRRTGLFVVGIVISAILLVGCVITGLSNNSSIRRSIVSMAMERTDWSNSTVSRWVYSNNPNLAGYCAEEAANVTAYYKPFGTNPSQVFQSGWRSINWGVPVPHLYCDPDKRKAWVLHGGLLTEFNIDAKIQVAQYRSDAFLRLREFVVMPDGRRLIGLNSSGYVIVDLVDGTHHYVHLFKYDKPPQAAVDAKMYMIDANTLLSIEEMRRAIAIRYDESNRRHGIVGPSIDFGGKALAICVSPGADTAVAFAVKSDHEPELVINRWDAKTGVMLAPIPMPTASGQIREMVADGEGRFFAICANDSGNDYVTMYLPERRTWVYPFDLSGASKLRSLQITGDGNFISMYGREIDNTGSMRQWLLVYAVPATNTGDE